MVGSVSTLSAHDPHAWSSAKSTERNDLMTSRSERSLQSLRTAQDENRGHGAESCELVNADPRLEAGRGDNQGHGVPINIHADLFLTSTGGTIEAQFDDTKPIWVSGQTKCKTH